MELRNQFEYDVAFTLCHQDFKFANEIFTKLNPSIKKFFYGQNQQEIINKSGPEKFADVFKNKSRLVVILYRNEWSQSFYTELEQNAILDRIKSGYSFIFFIQMQPGESLSWFPENRIYTRAYQHSIEEIVKFIEFKLTEMDVRIKPFTYKEKIEIIQNRFQKLRDKRNYLVSEDSYNKANILVNDLKIKFNEVIDSFENNSTFKQMRSSKFVLHTDLSNATLGFDNSWMQLQIQFTRFAKANSQHFIMSVSKHFNNKNQKPIDKYFKMNVDLQNFDFYGWSEMKVIKDNYSNYIEMYLQHYDFVHSDYYDLDSVIISNDQLINNAMNEIIDYIQKSDPVFN